jgi:hypothetical protein
MSMRKKIAYPVPLAPRHRRYWRRLWRYCICVLHWPCPDRRDPGLTGVARVWVPEQRRSAPYPPTTVPSPFTTVRYPYATAPHPPAAIRSRGTNRSSGWNGPSWNSPTEVNWVGAAAMSTRGW